ncbi:MAG: DUF934 domain-containing protein [Rhodobacteraceae bacterium]|nr:DUF934 domain-containing protein [Paracoccaceae bacterium]
MNGIVVRDDGFHEDDLADAEFMSLETLCKGVEAPALLHLENDEDPSCLPLHFCWLRVVRIPFPDFVDGRGFSLAASIRRLGYRGRLRAQGYLISDQYRQARQSGFDEVVIDRRLAARQPERLWLENVSVAPGSYQERLIGGSRLPGGGPGTQMALSRPVTS